ncbi:hypothetical protein GcM3_143015 [Golovinomyces cichoracearum]|uniref:Uncharacterized protein n=1 Tax=Golovinomyces cichoracearum TaxID=62708 RepID=A0A420HZR5_9PEZI|nr:hypothetical protein GcM3_143015 [Golovinomyces cichoracearum]
MLAGFILSVRAGRQHSYLCPRDKHQQIILGALTLLRCSNRPKYLHSKENSRSRHGFNTIGTCVRPMNKFNLRCQYWRNLLTQLQPLYVEGFKYHPQVESDKILS